MVRNFVRLRQASPTFVAPLLAKTTPFQKLTAIMPMLLFGLLILGIAVSLIRELMQMHETGETYDATASPVQKEDNPNLHATNSCGFVMLVVAAVAIALFFIGGALSALKQLSQ